LLTGARRGRPRLPRAALVAALGLAAATLGACVRQPGAPVRDLSYVRRWWILIGASYALDALDWRAPGRDAQMVVLTGDPRERLGELPEGTVRLGYLSVGEADRNRREADGVRGQGFLVEPNPDWPDNVRVDIRDPRWQELLLEREVPRLLARGFDGLMLDTIDTAPYLEAKDRARFRGSREALRHWLGRLRARFPHAVVIANATLALPDAAPYVDGFVVEGLFATYDFGLRRYRATTGTEQAWKLAQIERARRIAPRPVFTIEYADVGDVALGSWAEAESARYGFHPYVTVKDLNALP
jgi:uncharacterized protein (TIGR01370 family)